MSDPENFLARWSRRKSDETRKHDAADETREADARGAEASDAADSGAAKKVPEAEPAFDLASLPPVESITADTDIRAFFVPGVPADLTRAALRRAWSADPKIKDFVGLAENAWDFNNPGSIPGFGALEMTPELRREVARIVGRFLPEDEASAAAARPVPESAPSFQAPEPSPQIAATPVADYRPDEIAGSAPVESNMQPVESAPPTTTAHRNKDDIAAQQQSRRELSLPSSTRRGHGGALPK